MGAITGFGLDGICQDDLPDAGFGVSRPSHHVVESDNVVVNAYRRLLVGVVTTHPLQLTLELTKEALQRELTVLEIARSPGDIDRPGYRLRPLRDDHETMRSIRLSRNWRLTFRFKRHDVVNVDLVDYQ